MEKILGNLGFFDNEAQQGFISLCTEEKLNAGAALFDYSELAEKMFFLENGQLAVHKKTGFLQKMQVIALLSPGAVIGEAALLEGHVRDTRIIAIEDSRLFCLERRDFVRFQQEFPESAFRLLEYLLSIASLRLEKTSERLARIL